MKKRKRGYKIRERERERERESEREFPVCKWSQVLKYCPSPVPKTHSKFCTEIKNAFLESGEKRKKGIYWQVYKMNLWEFSFFLLSAALRFVLFFSSFLNLKVKLRIYVKQISIEIISYRSFHLVNFIDIIFVPHKSIDKG